MGIDANSVSTPKATAAAPSVSPTVTLAPSGEDLGCFAWYRHEVNRETAVQILSDRPVGSFLVRPSSQPNCLALSHKTEHDFGGVGHMLLRYGRLRRALVSLTPHMQLVAGSQSVESRKRTAILSHRARRAQQLAAGV